jgi:hypothetical protein
MAHDNHNYNLKKSLIGGLQRKGTIPNTVDGKIKPS